IKKDTKIKLIEAGTNFSKIQIVTSTNNGKEYYAPAGQVPSVLNEIRTLTSDLTEIYEDKPDLNKLTDTVAREDVFNKKDLRSVKDSSEVLWYFINIDERKGWIKDSELTKISAYNWKAFGFEVLKDQADEFLYDPKSPTPFLNKLCSYLEGEDGEVDKYVTTAELQGAFRNQGKAKKISRLVCYHSSEWYW
ncbi:MAG TPA: hypothetical protein VF691_04820, partial [Cytophagaceae bacterium]